MKLSTVEVAEMAGITSRNVVTAINKGKLRASRSQLNSRSWIIESTDALAFAAMKKARRDNSESNDIGRRIRQAPAAFRRVVDQIVADWRAGKLTTDEAWDYISRPDPTAAYAQQEAK